MDMIIERLLGVASAFLILSLVVEKINDFWKLNKGNLSIRGDNPIEEKTREKRILARNITVGIILALFLKADAMQMLISGEPSEVIGWENVFFYSANEDARSELSIVNQQYFRNLSFDSPSKMQSVFAWLFNLLGIIVTGVSLSFGSKFWHDVVAIIYEIKEAKVKIRTGSKKSKKEDE